MSAAPGFQPSSPQAGRDFERDRRPADVGHDFAAVWQGVLDTWEHCASVRLPIDLNVASVPSPSAAEFAD